MSDVTEGQKRELKRNGFVVLDGILDDDVVAAAREELWRAAPWDRDDLDALVDGPERTTDELDVEDWEPYTRVNERVYECVAPLVGDALEPPGERMSLIMRLPNGEQREGDQAPPPHREHGHVDGYGPAFRNNKEVGSYAVVASVYFDDVEPRGGGFTVWPGTHWTVAEYYREHQLESIVGPPHSAEPPGVDGEGGWDYSTRLSAQHDPLEIWGEAGTVVLWHENLLHAGGVNRSGNVRMAGVKRFRREDRDEIRRDARRNPWKYWEGMQDVELPLDVG